MSVVFLTSTRRSILQLFCLKLIHLCLMEFHIPMIWTIRFQIQGLLGGKLQFHSYLKSTFLSKQCMFSLFSHKRAPFCFPSELYLPFELDHFLQLQMLPVKTQSVQSIIMFHLSHLNTCSYFLL